MDRSVVALFETFQETCRSAWLQHKTIKRKKGSNEYVGYALWRELLGWLNIEEIPPQFYFLCIHTYLKAKGMKLTDRSSTWFATPTARSIALTWRDKLAKRTPSGQSPLSPFNSVVQNAREEARGSAMLVSDLRLGGHPVDRRLRVLGHVSAFFWAFDSWYLCPPIQEALSAEMKDYVSRLRLWLRDNPYISSFVSEGINESTSGHTA